MFRVLAIVGVAGLASCTGDTPAAVGPAPPEPPANAGESDMLNSLPSSLSNPNTLNSSAGVVGVTHLPP